MVPRLIGRRSSRMAGSADGSPSRVLAHLIGGSYEFTFVDRKAAATVVQANEHPRIRGCCPLISSGLAKVSMVHKERCRTLEISLQK